MSFPSLWNFLSQSIVRNLDIPIDIHEYILWFQIPIDVVVIMEIRQCQINLSRIELSLVLIKLLEFLEMFEKLSSSQELHHKEHFILGLESIFQIYQERVLRQLKDLPLCPSFFQMLLINQILLPHRLHSIILIRSFQLAQHNLPKRPLPKHFLQLELMEVGDVGCCTSTLENQCGLPQFLILFRRVHNLRFYVLRVLHVLLPLPCLQILDSSREGLQCFIIIVIQSHFLLDNIAVPLSNSLHNLHFQVSGGEPVIVLILNMEHEFWSMSAHRNPTYPAVRYFPLDPCPLHEIGEEGMEPILREDVVHILAGNEDYPLLLLLHMVHFDHHSRQDYGF